MVDKFSKRHVLLLSDYHAANLREALITLRTIGCDTGDWLGELLYMLPQENEVVPNQTREEQLERIRWNGVI